MAKKPEGPEKWKKQPLASFAGFFSGDLKVPERDTASKRAYFVSAQEVRKWYS